MPRFFAVPVGFNTLFQCVLIFCLIIVGCSSAERTSTSSVAEKREGEDWPQFLGPRDTGISGETDLLDKWPDGGPPRVWSMRIGTGYSAPSVRGNRLVLHHRLGDEEIVECFTADTGD